MFTREAEDTAVKPPDDRRRARARRLLIVTAVALVAATLFVVVRAWLAPDDEQAPPAAGASTSAAPAPTAGAGASTSAGAPAEPAAETCAGWPNSDQAGDLTTAPPASWSFVGGIAVPSDPAAGPAFTDPVRWCYAHTPAGALFAVVNHLAQSNPDAGAALAALMDLTVASGPSKDELIGRYAVLTAKATSTIPPGQQIEAMPQIVGFHFLAYSPAVATVELANTNAGGLYSSTWTVQWESGDWKVAYPYPLVQGVSRQLPQPMNPGYFTPWGGVL